MDFKKLFADFKKETGVICIILVIVAIALSFFAYQKGGRDFDEEVIKREAKLMESFQPNYDNMKEEYEKIKNDYDIKLKVMEAYEKDIEEMEVEIDSLSAKLAENKEKVEKIENYETIISDLETTQGALEVDISSLEVNVKNLEEEKEELQEEIDKLNGKLVEAAGTPIELQAGMWFQEVDEIPVGRYTVSNGDGNFFVRDEDGIAYVNIILDDSDSGWGVTDYTFVLIEGAMIENDSPCILTPVN